MKIYGISTKTNIFWGSVIAVCLITFFTTRDQFYFALIEVPIVAGIIGVGQGALVTGGSLESGSWAFELDTERVNGSALFWSFDREDDEAIFFIPLWPIFPMLIIFWVLALRRNRRLVAAGATPNT